MDNSILDKKMLEWVQLKTQLDILEDEIRQINKHKKTITTTSTDRRSDCMDNGIDTPFTQGEHS